jgi:hypothetical protein
MMMYDKIKSRYQQWFLSTLPLSLRTNETTTKGNPVSDETIFWDKPALITHLEYHPTHLGNSFILGQIIIFGCDFNT